MRTTRRFPPFDDFTNLTSMFAMADFYQLHNLRQILIQPLLKHYLSRLHLYSTWDGLHPIPKPLNPVHALNFARTYEVRVNALVPVIMVDLTVFVSEAELLSAREPRRSSVYKPGLNQSQDRDFCPELWEHHKSLTKSVARVLTKFDAERLFSRRERCCSFKGFYERLVQKLEKKAGGCTVGSGEWMTESHGRYGLELIRGVRTDEEGRSGFCEECLREVDGEVMEVYRAWWERIPRILGLEGGWDDETLEQLQFGEMEAWK